MDTTETAETAALQPATGNNKLIYKCVFIGLMALALWVPTLLILELVRERASRQQEAVTEISNKWAGKQNVSGPLLMIPYQVIEKDSTGFSRVKQKNAYFIPDKLDIQSSVQPEIRYRGIYEVPVYRSRIKLSGKFNKIDWEQLNIPAESILWDKACLIFDISDDIKGVNEDINLQWDEKNIRFNPQSIMPGEFADAFSAPFPITASEAALPHQFSFSFPMNGTEQLMFSPSARETRIDMDAPWENPSFQGLKLPETRKLSDSGFTATWKLLNRSSPGVWDDRMYNLQGTSVGTHFIVPLDNYNKTERSVKYAILCIILTFASFFLVERIYKRPLHLVQYGLAGTALVLFYSLLLSISEYTGFNMAYWLSAVATIGLVSWYVSSIMHSSKLALFISFVLSVVYTYIFTIIQLEDYALLMGSIGLFVALGVIMFFTRKINWENG